MPMPISFLFLPILLVFTLQLSSPRTLQHPELIVQQIHRKPNTSCGTGNPIDDCWRCDPKWAQHRQSLADCAVGFGKNATGGKGGRIYVVNSTADDPVDPTYGTLRHAVTQSEPLWIIFKGNMNFSFKQELIVASNKTIDGRGSAVRLVGPACLTVQDVSNVIIANIEIRNCTPTGNATVRSNATHFGFRGTTDGDGISIFQSSNVWVDHCSLSNCSDGLIDAVEGSTNITISNCYFTQHNEVMLLGHSDGYDVDKRMLATIAFNHFGEGLMQRMPRCRHGYFHVVLNDYTHWGMYAIGGSANPMIYSQGNRFTATLDNNRTREVTKRINCTANESRTWNWMSNNDIMVNGAYFVASGSSLISDYAKATSLEVGEWGDIDVLTAGAGVLDCEAGTACSN